MPASIAQQPEVSEYAPYYEQYVSRFPGGDVVETLTRQLDETTAFFAGISESEAMHRYAPEKWSIKEVLGHMIDGERIFGYRVLRFSRSDATPIEGFDQNEYVRNGAFDRIPLSDLVEEFTLLRRANIHLFRHLDDEGWKREGVASGYPVSVRALARIIAGHEIHHREVIRERYLS
ncbi:MAG: Squalene-hopene cyclase [Chlorobi bacterium]|nr:Squalene-hopene cyclase [Chlorobiota bacterium]